MKLKTLVAMGSALAAFSMSTLAADVTLRFAHPWPANSAIHQGFAEWGKMINEDSQGRIDIELYPSQTLVKAGASYDAVVNNIADMTATVQGYTANRFPLSQIVELPGMVNSGSQGSCLLQKLYDEGQVSSEYDDSHVLFVYTNGPGQLHSRDKEMLYPDDLKGMRIRRPTVAVGTLLENLGAQPVGMPAPEIYQSLQRDVIDGVAISWDGTKVFRLNELVNYHTQVNLYSLAFVVTMNKNVYAKLPDDLKAVLDKYSGAKWSQYMTAIFDNLDKESMKEAVEMGDKLIPLTDDARKAWEPVLGEITEQYINDLEAKGIPARKVYERAVELKEVCGV
ncbi:TRAP transporter substrate-binding protein [Marinobacterium lutimaris]|uniref:TRAP-type C4-dicarboxylate transport system, substrate-binding protein n=1 Tax=Marinobacterium lutimaris TaxID=568106 RepID=A0A1H6C448_9GAMM|nr:TRAP transporter substrate-binding protein [Marinobacterium lutimaris]SEG67734.1 TRAP-type C4-dicarboxylate transport system, substrate-binding protein [Marinobacterium lutimaris]